MAHLLLGALLTSIQMAPGNGNICNMGVLVVTMMMTLILKIIVILIDVSLAIHKVNKVNLSS